VKIFEGKEKWGNKVNFVDENNVVVGYDLDQCCCEDAGYFVSKEIQGEELKIEELDLRDYRFDTSFFQLIEDRKLYDEGGAAVFKIINGEQELFIHLYNNHNGYYGHGFKTKIGGVVIPELSGGL